MFTNPFKNWTKKNPTGPCHLSSHPHCVSRPFPLNSIQLPLASTSLQLNGLCLSHSGFGRQSRLGVIKALCGANCWLNTTSSLHPRPSSIHSSNSNSASSGNKGQIEQDDSMQHLRMSKVRDLSGTLLLHKTFKKWGFSGKIFSLLKPSECNHPITSLYTLQ